MAGTLHALLLRSSDESPRQAALPMVLLAPGCRLALLPLTNDVVESLLTTAADHEPVVGFYDLKSGVAEWARRYSRQGVVAYLHTEFFGGGGFHAAMAWRDEAVAWGPLFTATSAEEAEDHYAIVTDRRDMAGNVLLRWLSVQREDQIDEFAAAGLDRRRWMKDWAALAAQ